MKRFTLTPQYFGSIVFDRRTCRYYPFDAEATDLMVSLSGCDGTCSSQPAEPELAFYKAFHAAGFFGLDGRFDCDIRTTPPFEGNLTGPLAVHLEVSGECNLRCRHCFADLHSRKGIPLSLEEMDNLFAELSRMGSFRLGITGGEPFLRQDFLEIVDTALSYGLHPCITTNGTILSQDRAVELGKRDPLWLNISLEGATAMENDAVRGAGVFEKVMDGLRVLRAHCEFALCFTVTSRNFDRVQECVRLAERVGATTAVFRPLYPVGAATVNLDLMPTFEMYRQALATLSRLEGCVCRIVDSFGPESSEPGVFKASDLNGCGAGWSVCSISLYGDVSPCSFLGEDSVVGTLRDGNFGWLWRENPGFAPYRRKSEERFGGGCRLRALSFNGGIDRPDPWYEQWRENRNLMS